MSRKTILLSIVLLIVSVFAFRQERLQSSDPIFVPLPSGQKKTELDLQLNLRLPRQLHTNLGAISCSSSNCHGSNQAGTSHSKRAYLTWKRKDPHARAFETLSQPASLSIGKRLGLAKLPVQSQVCLNCHASPANDNTSVISVETNSHSKLESLFQKKLGLVDSINELQPQLAHQTAADFRSNGVSCEACHGASENWLEPHRSYDWNSGVWSKSKKESIGFRDVSQIASRAKQCVRCHIGEPGKDVNHQLIAAGHPRLFFDYSAYMNLYAQKSAHWDVKNDQLRFAVKHLHSTDFHALDSWMIGKLVTYQKSLELLHSHAVDAESDMPEFAEYSCYTCHHNLSRPKNKQENWRQKLNRTGLKRQIPWNQWNQTFVAEILNVTKADPTGETEKLMDALSLEMSTIDGLSRKSVAKLSLKIADRIADCLKAYQEQTEINPQIAVALLEKIRTSKEQNEITNWDQATQYYLAIIPLKKSLYRSEKERLKINPLLVQIKEKLQFLPAKKNGDFSLKQEEGYNSPFWQDDTKLKQIDALLEEILEELSHAR